MALFTISHRVKLIGSRAQATRLVYEKAASLCIAAGYSHFKILDQESNAAQEYEDANASIRVQLYQQDAEGRIGCEAKASTEYIDQAHAKLTKRGYQPPAPSIDEPEEESGAASSSCTVEQITAMVKAGFQDQQIKAACPD